MAALRSLSLLTLAALAAAGCGRDALTFGSSAVAQLRVEPGQLDLYRGQSFQFDVIYSTSTVARSVLGEGGLTLSVDPSDLVTVAANGAGSADAPGSGRIQAEFASLRAAATFTVRDATLVGLKVEPASVVVGIYGRQQLEVIGELSDGSTVDLTAGASGTTYSSGAPAVVVVSDDGLVRGVSAGAAQLTVVHGPFQVAVPVEVTDDPDTLVAMRIEPTPIIVQRLEGAEYRLLGTTASGTEIDVFAEGYEVELSVANPAMIRVSPNFVESIGEVGVTRIECRVGLIAASANVEVRDAERELVGLAIEPEFLALGLRESAQLRVVGFYSDGSVGDLTAAASGTTYSVDGPGVVGVSPDGQVVAMSPGGTVVIARNQGFEAIVFIEVIGERELLGIEVQPPQLFMELNQQVQLTVIAFYSDGSIEDVTRQANYLPPMSGIVAVSGSGLVSARAPGEDVLFVNYQGFDFPVRVGVEETMNQVVEVRIRPRLIQLQEGQPFFNLDVIAVFADGSQRTVIGDPSLVISVDDPSIAFWDGIALVGLRGGQTTLRATYLGVTGTARVQVEGTTSVLLRIELSVPSSIGVGQTAPISVVAFFSDGSIVDITTDPQVILRVDNVNLATVSPGAVTGVAVGQTTVRAFYQGQQDSAPIQVTPNTDPVVSIRWQPASLTINTGASGRARVIATRQSGLEQNVSNDPALNLAFMGPLSLTTVPGDVVIGGIAPGGNGSVLATYQGLSATLPVTVQSTGPTLDGIQIIVPGQIAVTQTAPFVVVAFFTDGSVQEITNDPGLNLTAVPPLVTFGPNSVQGVQAGTTVITATWMGETSQATVVVTAITDRVARIFFTPASLTIPVNQRRGFTVTAVFVSGAQADITFDPFINYSFNGPITPAPGAGGQIDLIGNAAGMASVVADYRGQSATLPVSVTSSGPTVVRILLQAPANLDLGSNGTYAVIAEFSDGTSADVTSDPGVMVFVENPAIFSAAGGVLTPLQVGTTRLGVSYQGFSAQRTINVVNNNPFTSIRFQPTSLSLTVGQSATVQVIGRRANGATENITAQVNFTSMGPVTLGPAGTDLPILANTPGTASVQATFNGLTANLTVTIMGTTPPTITAINPSAVAVGTAQIQLIVDGTGFANGDTVVVDGIPLPTIFVSGTQVRARVPGMFFASIDELDVQVFGAAGPSNAVTLSVGVPPAVTSYAPNSVVQGSSIDVVVIGSGLTSLTASIPGLTATVLSVAPDGALARIRVSAAANVMAGPYTLTLSNPWGNASVTITVVPSTGQMDLVVASGQTRRLSGTNVFNNITVNTGGRIIGTGLEPLALIATGNIIIRGSIDVSGDNGEDGFTNPADGGAAGPGGGGGGGGGDGNAATPSTGGAGSHAGEGGGPASGAGTPAGDGGGAGAGTGGAGGCGQGGGGGALGGNGGSGGGDLGDGTGGAGGIASSGSAFGAGTGGGGGSTCGTNSGGGGGGGGGALILQVALGGTVSIEGSITANGGNGGFGFSGTGGGGGGSGGLVEVTAPGGTITLVDTISARGGRGGNADFGDGGGGGSGGRIILDASPGGMVDTTLGLFDVTGGAQGIPLGTGFAGRGGNPGVTTTTP